MNKIQVVNAFSVEDVANVVNAPVVDHTAEFKIFLKENKLDLCYGSVEAFFETDMPRDNKAHVITIEKGKANKVTTPVKYNKVEKVAGTKKFVKKFVWVDKGTNEILLVCESVKQSGAKKEVASLFNDGYRGTAVMRVMKLTENDVLAEATLKTTKSARLGEYVVFKFV